MSTKLYLQSEHFVPPIMYAFRSAHKEKDATKALDIRSAADERVIAGRRSTPRNSVNESALKQELADDLSALLNTINLAAAENLDGLDEVKHSILNYGIDELTAISTGSKQSEGIAPRLVEVLQDYEVRLVAGTVKIVADLVTDEVNSRVSLHVSGEMFATPSDVAVEFIADVEPYSGKVKVKQG